MFFLKTRQSVGIRQIWCLTRWSSGISDKSYYKELLEHISKQDKVKSEQFRTLLPCIQKINKSPPSYKLSAADTTLQQTPLSELTNILDAALETENAGSSNNNEENSNEKSPRSEEHISIEETTADCPPVDTLSETEGQPPKSLPVLISSLETKIPCFQWDLGSAALPISLHRGENNFLAVAVANDIKHAYYKTLETTEHWRTVAQQQVALQPGTITGGSGRSLEKAITLVEQSSLWLCQPKPSAASAPKTPKSEESLIDKIKMAIEQMLTLLKAKLEEQKKERDQKKAEEQKKEAKAE